MKQKLLFLMTLLVLCVTGVWGANDYSNPLTETFTGGKYGNYTFLDVANTTFNATIKTGSVKCLTYGAYYAWNTLNSSAPNKWMTRDDAPNLDNNNHGYDNPADYGFIATTSLTESDNGFGGAKITSARTTCFYVTGCTGVAILGKDAGKSKFITLKVEEIALDGTLTQRNTKEKKQTSVYLLESDATMTADKYYRVTVASASGSNSYLYQIRFTQGTSSSYAITWANGGHGTAPTEPASAALLTLPTMDADGGYVNTGWTADVAVKQNGVSQVAGTVLEAGSSVRLTGATTFTGVWKSPSTFALSSASEVEVTIGGATSQITYSNAVGTVTYESADESVATVSADGEITAVAGGKTTITVKDPGNASVAEGSATVTVLVPFANPAAATSYVLNQDTYAFSNTANTKYYFTNGFTIDVTGGGADFQNATYAKSKKYSHARTYTINVPSTVTVTYAVMVARNNYEDKDSNPAANWGTVFGTDYSSIALPWAAQAPAEKDFVIASPVAGGTLVFQPGGNQWQAIITLYTDAYLPKHTVSYLAGDGTGSMEGVEIREGSEFMLPIQGAIAAPAGKYFVGWNDGVKDYVPGDAYTMPTSNVSFTAQWATSAEANHYHYSYKDATRYNGTTFTDPVGAASSFDGNTKSLTDGNLCSSLGGITSVSFTSAKYDAKNDYRYMNSYLKIEKDGTPKVTINIADGYAGTLTLKAGGYSKNPTIAISNSAVLKSGSVGGVATKENNYNELVYALNAGANEITCTSQNMYISEMDIVTWPTSVSGTITDSGWNTFSSTYALDLSAVTGGTAYVASAAAGSTVTLTSVDDKIVAAGTGLMIKGTVGETFTIVTTTEAATFSGTNKLVGLPTGGTVAKDNHNYVFGWKTASNPGFYRINDTEPVLAAGKAYLHADADLTTSARLSIVFDDETTGIADVRGKVEEAKGEFYNLAGQRVAQPTKGLFIVNGKKVIIK